MPALHISPKNPSHKHKEFIDTLKNAPIAFILVYMEGCGPCGQVRPEWEKIYKDKPFLKTLDPRVVIADIDHTILGIDTNKDLLTNPPNAFPNIRKITSTTSDPSKQMYEEYNGNRSYKDIKDWIITSLKDSSLKKSSLKTSSLKKSANHHNSYSFGGGSSKKTKRLKNKNKNKNKKSKNQKVK